MARNAQFSDIQHSLGQRRIKMPQYLRIDDHKRIPIEILVGGRRDAFLIPSDPEFYSLEQFAFSTAFGAWDESKVLKLIPTKHATTRHEFETFKLWIEMIVPVIRDVFPDTFVNFICHSAATQPSLRDAMVALHNELIIFAAPYGGIPVSSEAFVESQLAQLRERSTDPRMRRLLASGWLDHAQSLERSDGRLLSIAASIRDRMNRSFAVTKPFGLHQEKQWRSHHNPDGF